MYRILLSTLFFVVFFSTTLNGQELYFPPIDGSDWETSDIENLGWCQDKVDALYQWLDSKGTEMFIVLKDGKIVLEQYFDGADANTSHVWNSAGKSMMAFLIGIAQEDGLVNIDSSSGTYLLPGWTSLNPSEEQVIKLSHQLSMTSGLDESEFACTDPVCLNYIAPAGERWAYHNSPYTLLGNVLENASGQTLNIYTNQNLKSKIGMTGLWLPLGYYTIYTSNIRSFARFGLLTLNQGIWDGESILGDKAYFLNMTSPSQSINPAYGYLWWLNGSEHFMLPGSQFVFSGSIAPSAPDDMIVAAGKNGQFLNVIPSENLVIARMGSSPDLDPVPLNFNDELVSKVLSLSCETAINYKENLEELKLYPNPFYNELKIDGTQNTEAYRFDFFQSGKLVYSQKGTHFDRLANLEQGTYLCRISKGGHFIRTQRLIKLNSE